MKKKNTNRTQDNYALSFFIKYPRPALVSEDMGIQLFPCWPAGITLPRCSPELKRIVSCRGLFYLRGVGNA